MNEDFNARKFINDFEKIDNYNQAIDLIRRQTLSLSEKRQLYRQNKDKLDELLKKNSFNKVIILIFLEDVFPCFLRYQHKFYQVREN